MWGKLYYFKFWLYLNTFYIKIIRNQIINPSYLYWNVPIFPSEKCATRHKEKREGRVLEGLRSLSDFVVTRAKFLLISRFSSRTPLHIRVNIWYDFSSVYPFQPDMFICDYQIPILITSSLYFSFVFLIIIFPSRF